MAGMRIAERQSQDDDNNEGTAVSDKKRACTRSISPVGNKACWTLKKSWQVGSTCTIVAMRRQREHTVCGNGQKEGGSDDTGQNDEANRSQYQLI